MVQRRIICSFFLVAVVAGALLAPYSHARVVRFDLFGSWDQPTFLDLAVDGTETVDLGFEIDFGLGATSAIRIHENGFVTFGTGQQITVFKDPDFDFASRISNPLEDETPGALTYSQGVFDLDVDFGDEPTDAFRVTWFDPPANTAMQLLLRADDLLDPRDFTLQLNYGCDASRAAPCDVVAMGGGQSTAGLTLGDNRFAITGPFTSTVDYDFRFVDGVLVETPVAVSTPASLGILLSGVSLLFLRGRRIKNCHYLKDRKN